MKITKTKEVITEEIEIQAGIYYFEDSNLFSYKMILFETDEYGFADYKMEILSNFGNIYGIRIREEYLSSDNVPYEFKQFILGKSGKEISQQEFEKERQDILKRLC